MLSALRNRPIARLWLGQAMSSIGDEIYRVGLTWLAVGIIGADTGFLTAGQFAALMLLSFVGGKWADHWEAGATMIAVDLSRGLIVLIPVVYSYFAPVPLSLLVVVALILSALSAFFDPALQAALPLYSPSRQLLGAATGLMSTTIRLARMVGSAVVGILSGIVAPIHFFTIDALTFFASAASVRSILALPEAKKLVEAAQLEMTSHAPAVASAHASGKKTVSLSEALFSAARLIRRTPGMNYVMFAKAFTGGFWNLAFVLGYALLVQEIAPNDTRAFGFLMASYGAGNIAGALYFGNRERKASAHIMYSGYMWLGLGFFLVAIMPNLKWMMVLSAFTGIGGPMNELSFLDLIQEKFHQRDLTKIFRLRMALETGFALLLMLLSPPFFRLYHARAMIGVSGVATVAAGFAGLLLMGKIPHPFKLTRSRFRAD